MGAASICAVTLHGQSAQSPPQPQTTFRSSTALVEVDAIMFDKAGKFVPGLKAEDVTLFEDGKPQTIETVLHGDAHVRERAGRAGQRVRGPGGLQDTSTCS